MGPNISASERGDLTLRHWQKLEAGDSNACLSTLAKVANGLDAEPRELFKPVPARRR